MGDKLWMHWNEHPMQLWQTQLNFAVWCASSACGVSSAHLDYTAHPMIRAVYRFHVYSQVNYCRGKILHAYGDIAGHCGRFGAKSDWLNFGAPMYRCRA